MEISLKALQDHLEGDVPLEECEEFYKLWDLLRLNGSDLLGKLERYILTLPQDFSQAFPSVVAATEEWFHKEFNSHKNPYYQDISPVVVALYDLLLSLKRSYEHKSAISCAMITRSLFEARVNLAEIERDSKLFAPQFTKYKEIARNWNEYQKNVIDQKEIISRLCNYPEWYDADWKTLKSKVGCWTGVPGDNVREMAKRNNLEPEYIALYKTTSAFVHISPIISNYYSIQGNGPLCSEQGVFEMSYLGLAQYIECYSLALKIVGLNPEEMLGSLKIPLLLFAKR